MSNQNNLPDIPVDWILTKVIDPLMNAAHSMAPDNTFREAIIARATYYMDLVETWQKHNLGE